MKNILLDTDIFIDHFRNYEPSKKFMETISDENFKVFVSVLTITEIMSGADCAQSNIRSQVEDFFASIETVDVNLDIAKKGAEFRRVYGTPPVDAIIAATAFKLNVPICSRNVKHYNKIKEIELKVPY